MQRTVILGVIVLSCCAIVACGETEADFDRQGVILETPATEPAFSAGPVVRIIGGSTFSGLPAVGALTENGQAFCTGTVIGPRKVVTAAHCLDGISAGSIRFTLGANVSQPTAVLRVASVQKHPSYDAYNIRNDIGVLTLSQDAPVEPMPVVTAMDSSWVGRDLFFVGYGVSNGYTQTGAGIKRAVWMKISRVDATTFRYDEPKKNTCSGDSGGPAFYRDAQGNFFVAGVTSYGDERCVVYGVDTRIDTYLSFLGLSQNASPPAGGCQGETWEGRCTGTTLTWCESNQVKQVDCATYGKICGPDSTGFNCVDAPVDPCKGETYRGRCDGQRVIWCEDQKVQSQDCAASGMVCVLDAARDYYACRQPTAPVDPCQGETYVGRCSNNTVIWCEGQQVKQTSCTARGMTCGYSAQAGYYGCL